MTRDKEKLGFRIAIRSEVQKELFVRWYRNFVSPALQVTLYVIRVCDALCCSELDLGASRRHQLQVQVIARGRHFIGEDLIIANLIHVKCVE